MKNRLLKTFTSLVLTVLMVLSIMPAFAITIGAEGGGTYKLVTDVSQLAVGDKVIIVAKDSAVAMSTTQNTKNRGQTTVTKTDDTIANISTAVQVFTLEQGTVDGTFAFQTGSGYIYAASSSSNNLKTKEDKDANGSWTISIENGVTTIKAQGTYTRNLLKYNSSSKIFSCYRSGQQDVSIYVKTTEGGSGGSGGGDQSCQHSNTEERGRKEPTCTEVGYEAGTYCNECQTYTLGGAEIPATGHSGGTATCTDLKTCDVCGEKYGELAAHNYVDGVCTDCGAVAPLTAGFVSSELGLSNGVIFYSNTVGNVTFRADKGEGSNAPAYYTNGEALRIYGKNTFSISVASGYKIVSVTIKSLKDYPTESNCSVDNGEATGLGTTDVVITPKDATMAITLTNTASNGHFKITEISVEYCQIICPHSNTENVAEDSATCTESGTTAGVKCLDCEKIISGCDVISATGHKDDDANGRCDVCNAVMCGENHEWQETERKNATCTEDGYAKYECSNCHETKTETLTATGHTEVTDEAVDATCTETGKTEGKHCSVCGTVLVEQTETLIIGHNYVDGKCTMCDKAEPYTFKVGDVVIFTGSKADGTDTRELTGFADGAKYGTTAVYEDTPTGKFLITVVEGYQSGTYAFKNGDKYITCNGQTNVNLSTTLDAKSSWNVSLDKDNNYEIKSCSNENYYLQYNPGAPRFTTYQLSSNQQPIKVVKYTGPVIKSFSLSLNEGVTVKVTFDIPEAWFNANKNAKVVFSNDKEFVITEAGEKVYSVDLTPAQINNDLTVKIQLADGSDYGATNNVSVSTYKAKVEAAYKSGKLNYTEAKYNALIDLLDAALTYSNAADGTGENLTNDFEGVADHSHAGELFTAFSGQLGTYASIYINVDTGKVPESGDTLVLKVGGTEIINGNIADYITKDRQIVISGLFPANFDDTIYIEASTEGSNATFTFNSYLKAVYKNSSDPSVKNLAVATYLYGLAAEAYLTAQ